MSDLTPLVPIEVVLTAAEMELAATVGARRQCENLSAGRPNLDGATDAVGWQLHIEGAAGEMAFAKWSNKFWSGNLGDLRAADVGKVQVRTTSRHNGSLILHERDRDDDAFVLVTGTAPRFVLRGWIRGRMGKRPEFWRDPAGGRPAFFVPQSVLRPMRAAAVSA